MNKILQRQIKRHFGSLDNVPKQLNAFLEDILNTYNGFNDDITLLQNSIEVNSQELRFAYEKHKEDALYHKNILNKVEELIYAIKPVNISEVLPNSDDPADGTRLFDTLIELLEERKQTEKEIRLLTQAVEQNPASIVVTDLNGNIEYVNPKFCSLTGYTKEEVLGQNPRVLKSDVSDGNTYKQLWSTITKGEQWKGEFLNKKKNGELFYELASISAVKNSNGEIVNFIAIKEDITESKKTKDTLENERSLFRTIIDLIPDAIYVKDLNGRKILANPKDVEFAGKQNEAEIIGKTDAEIYPSEQATKSYNEDYFVIKTGNAILNNEGLLIDKKGHRHFLTISKVPIYDVNGKITGLVGVTHDITERKEAADALSAAHKSLSDILNAAIYTSIIASDTNGIITVFSKGSENLLGYSAQEVIGKKTPAIFHLKEEMQERGAELSLEMGREISGFEIFVVKAKNQEYEERTWTYVCKNGSQIYVNLIVTAIRNQNDEITGFLGIASDITEQKLALEQVKRVSTRLALATQAGGIGVWELDIKNNIPVWDKQVFELYGFTKSDDLQESQIWKKSVLPEDQIRIEQEIQMAIRGEKNFDTEFRITWPNGSIHSIRTLATVQYNKFNEAVSMIGTNWDITEQKQTEAILLTARNEAEMANNAKSEFLANVSHEIRTPMNAIIGFAEILKDKITDTKQKEHVKTILSSGRTLLSLINDILDLSKIEAGKLEVEYEAMNFQSIINDIEQLFTPKIQSKGLSLEIIKHPNLPDFIYIDEMRFHQILFNIVGNAIKFTKKGFIRVETKALPSNKYDHIKLVIEIEDTGIGIPQNQQSAIFEAFTQQSGQSNRQFEGTGLGLAITKRLVEKMDGNISVESSVGKGSTFTLTFNAIQIAHIKTDATNKANEAEREIHFLPATIMVVDDIDFNIKVVENMIDFPGFTFISANSGEKAIEMLQFETPDIIFMDIRMHGMSGISATEIIKRTDGIKHIPVIAFTASALQNQMDLIHQLFDGYIHKPISKKVMIQTLKMHLKYEYGELKIVDKPVGVLDFKPDSHCAEIAKDVMDDLQYEIYDQWKEISDSLIIFEIEEFCDKLDLISQKHNCTVLNAYSTQLRESIQSFDVERIEKSVNEFGDLMQLMKNNVK